MVNRGLCVFEGDMNMASQTKKAKMIRSWKNKPNKANLKANMKRIEKNIELLQKLASKDKG